MVRRKLVAGLAVYLDEQTTDEVLILDAASGELLASFDGAGTELAVSPDGRLAAVHRWTGEGAAGELTFWDLGTGRRQSTVLLEFGLYRFTWSPDGDTIAAFQDWSLILLDAVTGEELWNRPITAFHADNIGTTLAAFSPDCKRIATADQSIVLWDAETGGVIQVFEGHAAPVLDMAFSPDGSRLITASQDGSTITWLLP